MLSLRKFIGFVNEYKELLTTITFFVGGILWVFGYFATKQEFHTFREATSGQNKTLHCLLQKHVQLLDAQQVAKTSQDELMGVELEIRRQTPSGAQFDMRTMLKLEQQKDDIMGKLAGAKKDAAEAKKAIMFRADPGSS